ncbi:hypoxia up-regulated protein 1 [Protopterus annectens]|uniref:hypoxia up-regulated protein 1 n=1 Tax=Protopterus annectens TaxID=7888 RepID=UPI001CFACDA9|nr:hypoxia up-regulated protein 1 [Protopterus annectens]
MALPMWTWSFFFLMFIPLQTDSLAVMSVDLGSEWMKIAIVKPGVPMEIVLNKESRRKTPVAVALKENERLFGESAVAMNVKNPSIVIQYLQNLLGKKIDNPQVKRYQHWFPYRELVKEEKRETSLFKLSEETLYSAEEVLGMVLNYSRSLAQEFAEQPIKDVVITVPPFFNQAERRAVLHAAQMAGLKVLQLINDNAAVALNYGVFRRKDINATAQNIMFYDMGSGSSTATIVTYQTTKTKDAGTQPQLQIRGVGFDRTLGGFEMDLRLRDHLAKRFNEQKKTKKNVMENPRAMAKLLKEANRVKTVLSANADHIAQEDIEQVILVGGATRVPKVQEALLKVVDKKELGKNINADEAAAMGAVYQAAALSKAFRVKPFIIRDAAMYPIQVEFSREVEEEEGAGKSIKHNKRILFHRMAPYPQRKVITFNRYTDDFEFYVNYGDLNFLSQDDLRVFGSQNLTTVKLKGVGESFKKHADEESKGIKAHFNMDESGVLYLDRVESVFETIVEEKAEEESTLTKLGNTISSLFGGRSTEPEKDNVTDSVQEEEEGPNEAEKEESKEKESSKPEEANEEKKGEGKSEESQTEGEKSEKSEKADSQDAGKGEDGKGEDGKGQEGTSKSAKDEEKEPKPARKMKKSDDIGVELNINDVLDPSDEELYASQKKLQDLADRDHERNEREKAANTLETFIFETKDKLYQEEYQLVSTEQEREEISEKLGQVSDWYDEDGYAASTKDLKEKLSELKKLCKNLFFKVEERKKWPDRLAALDSLLNHSTFFLRGARMLPEDDQFFTEIELTTLEKVINETTTWKNETVTQQNKLSPTEMPILLSKDIELKLGLLDREVKYLLNKAKFPKPKPKKEKNTTKSESDKNGATEDAEKVIPPQEKQDDLDEVKPAKEPPTVDKTEDTASETLELGGPGKETSEKKIEGETQSKTDYKNDEL